MSALDVQLATEKRLADALDKLATMRAELAALRADKKFLAKEVAKYIALSSHRRAEVERMLPVIDAFQWRPIETAPKDGTVILVSDKDEGVCTVFWHNIAEGLGGRGITGWAMTDSYNDEQGGWDTCYSPTHWMPLPKPPEEEKGGTK